MIFPAIGREIPETLVNVFRFAVLRKLRKLLMGSPIFLFYYKLVRVKICLLKWDQLWDQKDALKLIA